MGEALPARPPIPKPRPSSSAESCTSRPATAFSRSNRKTAKNSGYRRSPSPPPRAASPTGPATAPIRRGCCSPPEHRLVAVNATTGKIDPGFGNEGVVDIKIPWNGAPTVYKNVVMLGANNGENLYGPPATCAPSTPSPANRCGPSTPSRSRASPNFGTSWVGDSWKGFSGINVWGWYMTVDEAARHSLHAAGSPAGNYYGGDRPGANLYGNSLVAVDANTGKYHVAFPNRSS